MDIRYTKLKEVKVKKVKIAYRGDLSTQSLRGRREILF